MTIFRGFVAGLAASVGASAASANGKIIYFKGSEDAARAGAVVAAPAVAAPVLQYPAQVAAPPGVAVQTGAVVAAPAAVQPGCLNCTPGSAQARNYGAGTPNAIVTFLHPYTNKAVTIPMTLPVGKPSIITRSDRIIYDYGKFGLLGRYVVVRFYPDGTVMVKYH